MEPMPTPLVIAIIIFLALFALIALYIVLPPAPPREEPQADDITTTIGD